MERISVMTGARAFFGSGNFKSGVREIQKDLQSQFLLTFLPRPNDPERPAHILDIRPMRKDVRIRFQKQFFVSAP